MTEAGPVDLIDDEADDADDVLPPPPEGDSSPHAGPPPSTPWGLRGRSKQACCTAFDSTT